ncbi:hypothetical protein Micr_00867 [Candidatus Micrarchaeum sp.]|jgi:hypothetical protein|uniref:hypothetical protein n=1 Tax=Candidatus Micrarchaeum sp. TaxID=2282148 RepID=UPI000927A166|nr:hypothetical protein [Candidatus Micrarchaeum sp.]OJI06837.1 MAG: hypothetical protein BK997_04820 [Candidatus Micrarchaeum sp. ARMAN-1]OJT94110.1 MAG: hypothetical protein JJ59_03960 [Candidatus Micrarchaeum sp. AZ1]OWP54075.1 MAG: hypothetical protein B2I19_00235 [Thermoplasmatales archaeon ARMAN]QRF74331.1 hypothetical protein Micr_00867 [Candidatus Micrarchaeum sp.]
MAKDTFTISRQELRRILTIYKVDESSMAKLFSDMEKAHRHINAIAFAGMLEKINLKRDAIVNVLRRLGMDDVTINSTIDSMDEQKLLAESGRIFEATINFS